MFAHFGADLRILQYMKVSDEALTSYDHLQ